MLISGVDIQADTKILVIGKTQNTVDSVSVVATALGVSPLKVIEALEGGYSIKGLYFDLL